VITLIFCVWQGTDNEKLILFDVGQFERISPPETLAILWTLVALSDNTRRRTLKSIAVKHLTGCSTINPAFLHHSDPSDKQAHDGVIKSDSGSHADTKWLRRTLSEAFDAAIEPLSDGTVRCGHCPSTFALVTAVLSNRFQTKSWHTCYFCEKRKHEVPPCPRVALRW